jgi:hypothetical protein
MMDRDMEAEKTIDGGIALLVEEVLDGMGRYLKARRAGQDTFEYGGSVLDLDTGLEKARVEYSTNISQLSPSFNRDKFEELRQRYLEFEETIAEMEGRSLDSEEGPDVWRGVP